MIARSIGEGLESSIAPILKHRFNFGQPLLVASSLNGFENLAMLNRKTNPTPAQAALAFNFSKALADSGVSPKAIAEKCDIIEQAVSNWKRTGKISREHLPAIADLTGWTVERLLGKTASESPPKETEPVQPSPTIGTTILQLGALLATLNVMGRASIAPLIAKVVENPEMAEDAAKMADAIAQSQQLGVKDESLRSTFGRAQKRPMETGFAPIDSQT